ncbi:MAG: hypothetical protein JZU55_13075, partial [Afipia sp.]|nr:hypothetical protein [Afipia sp.]
RSAPGALTVGPFARPRAADDDLEAGAYIGFAGSQALQVRHFEVIPFAARISQKWVPVLRSEYALCYDLVLAPFV